MSLFAAPPLSSVLKPYYPYNTVLNRIIQIVQYGVNKNCYIFSKNLHNFSHFLDKRLARHYNMGVSKDAILSLFI